MSRHLIIPDTQLRPGVPTEHIDWAAQAIVDYKPDVIVVLGDWWDFHSLNGYEEKGGLLLEGSRYRDDLAVGDDAFARLVAPMEAERARLVSNRRKHWNPRKIFLKGNHEDRADRVAVKDAKWEGIISSDQCNTLDFEVSPFLQVVEVDGIRYSHYFQNVNSRHPIGGSIDNRLNKIGESFIQGHEQGFLYGNRTFPTGRVKHGLVVGSYYQHDEGYKGRQGNGHWRGIVVLNGVESGSYDIMPLRLEYLRSKYT